MTKRLLFVWALCTWAQLLPAQPANYLRYYNTIARAEAALTSRRYEEAMRLYDSAFTAFEFNMPGDCYLAAQLSAYSGDTGNAARHLRRSIVFGLPVSTINGNPRLKALIGAGLLPEQVLDSCRAAYRTRINPEARRDVIAMARADQRLIYDPALTGGNSIYDRKANLKAALQPVWDSLLRELLRITDAYGFPAERIAGMHASADSLFPEGIANRYGWPVLVHHGRTWPLLKDRLFIELQHGNISPRLYGAIADYSNRGQNPDVPYRAMLSCWYDYHSRRCDRIVKPRLAEIDSARAAIGLCSYEVMQEKEELERAYQKWVRSGAPGNPPVFDFIGVGWEAGAEK